MRDRKRIAGDEVLPLSHRDHIDAFDQPTPAEFVNAILGSAIVRRATDIHLETFQGHVRVRFRIDGVLEVIPAPLDLDSVIPVVARLKVLSGLASTRPPARLSPSGRRRPRESRAGDHDPRGDRPARAAEVPLISNLSKRN